MSWVSRQKPQLKIGLVVLVLWGGLSLATYRAWIHGADHRDFYPRWAGARLVLSGGHDLYSEETTRLIQTALYGAPLPPEVDQQGFAYPAQLVVLLMPFWFIDDVEIATAVWEGFSVLLMLWTLLLLCGIWDKALIGIAIMMLVWHYSMLMLFQAQVTALPLAAVGMGYWAYARRRDALAGGVMSVGFVKPELVLVPVALILFLAVRGRRWGVLKGFAFATSIAFVASCAIAGWWIPGWLQAVGQYAVYAKVVVPIEAVWGINPFFGVAVAALMIATLFLMRWDERAVVAASVPLGMLLLPQSLVWGMTMLVIPLVMSWRGTARWAVAGLWVLGWLLILGGSYPDWWKVQSILMPALTLAVVGFASRQSAEQDAGRHMSNGSSARATG